jgi:hypothetical protein
MRWLRGAYAGCDSLDVAAVWPASASVAGMPLPEVVPARPREDDPMREKKEAL